MTILAHLKSDVIHGAYAKAGGHEIESGKFASPESSAALAANVFAYFCGDVEAKSFPRDGNFSFLTSPVECVDLELSLRFPWSGGMHPWLDAVIETKGWLVGIESKRYEPFRDTKTNGFSEAYDRDVWGSGMQPYSALKDAIKCGKAQFRFLDAVQLIKHAFGIRTQAAKSGKRAALVYVYAEPRKYPNGRAILEADFTAHRHEVNRFAKAVEGAEVRFSALTHKALNKEFETSTSPSLVFHANAVRAAFLGNEFS